MGDLLVTIQQWIPANILIGLAMVSIFSFIGSLILIPLILIYLPSDYFDTRIPRHWMKDHHPVLRVTGLIIKNIMGAVFVIAGFMMLFLPGQGLLTMLIGVSFMDFPKKPLLEARMIGQPMLLNTINAVRHKFNKPPFTLSPDPKKF